uniref:Nose resistant-to-fluoxetine protein N-terminal domain-containing protein n=1 Tax=Romanomermis culicivorax TaxID=13658 RepID=A0A915JAW5_ROMCU
MSEDEILDQLDHDPENETTLAKVASLCGRLRNASSPYISDDCFKDLDFVACSLFDFIRNLKKLIKGSNLSRLKIVRYRRSFLLSGECNYGHSEREVQECNDGLKKKLVENMWPIYMFDSFGKLPSGLNRLNLMPLGRYTDCNSIIVPRTTNGGRSFEGNYCRATFRIPMPETSAQISRQCHGQHKLINAFNMTF